ncbi:hypothetical protein BpHYR1_010407, partial [Brachionus plicatilis]
IIVLPDEFVKQSNQGRSLVTTNSKISVLSKLNLLIIVSTHSLIKSALESFVGTMPITRIFLVKLLKTIDAANARYCCAEIFDQRSKMSKKFCFAKISNFRLNSIFVKNDLIETFLIYAEMYNHCDYLIDYVID